MHQSIDKKNKVVRYLILLLILSTFSAKLSENQKKYSLKIDKIDIIGLSKNQNLEIKNNLSNIFNKNIFFLRKEEIHKIVKKYNVIEKYSIKKVYPSTLSIEIKPTKLLARITGNNQLIVGANGKLISNELNNRILPYIFGEFNSRKFLKFNKNIERSKFNFDEFKTVFFFPSNRWDILTIGDILIKLPQKNITESLNLAHKIINSRQFKDMKVIDLRVKNHLVIQ